MITAKVKVEIELDMKLRDYTNPNVSEIKSKLKEELLKIFKDVMGEDEITEKCELTSNISITQLEVNEE